MGERNRRSKEIEVGNRDPKEITNIITKKSSKVFNIIGPRYR